MSFRPARCRWIWLWVWVASREGAWQWYTRVEMELQLLTFVLMADGWWRSTAPRALARRRWR
jgi:hypothetical protein